MWPSGQKTLVVEPFKHQTYFFSVVDGHNGQPKATIDHWGWGDDSTTSSVVGNFENQDQGNWLESANDYDEMVQRSHLCYQERQRSFCEN